MIYIMDIYHAPANPDPVWLKIEKNYTAYLDKTGWNKSQQTKTHNSSLCTGLVPI